MTFDDTFLGLYEIPVQTDIIIHHRNLLLVLNNLDINLCLEF